MLAVEGIIGMLADWAEWVEGKDDVLLELRTKCANKKALEVLEGRDQFIPAITMSPDEVISKYEKLTPDLESRIGMAEEAIAKNMPVRVCLDPMMYIRDYRNVYANMVDIIFSRISPECLRDVSIGSFRISKDYIKNFRKDYKNSSAAYFPYEIRAGYYQYPEDLRVEMEEFLYEKLLNYVPESKIFRWK